MTAHNSPAQVGWLRGGSSKVLFRIITDELTGPCPFLATVRETAGGLPSGVAPADCRKSQRRTIVSPAKQNAEKLEFGCFEGARLQARRRKFSNFVIPNRL
jgi:hypothetical protein